MKVHFSHHIFCSQVYGGISRYFVELMKEFDKRGIESGFDSPFYVSKYASDLPKKQARGRWIKKYPRTGRLLTLLGDCWAYLITPNARVIFHETYFSGFSGAKPLNAKVTTVYDCIHEVFPHYFDKNDPVFKYRKKSLETADQIICISESTKKDLVRFYKIPAEKLHVVALAVNTFRPENQQISHEHYILFVGHRNLYKNAKTLIQSFANCRSRAKGLRLVFFGGGEFNDEERILFESLGIRDNVFHVNGPDELLYRYYMQAMAFIFPSEYEGFGLPTLEAMSLGCPVICSKTSSFPEVAGDAALYFEPKNVSELTNQIDLLIESSELRSELIEKGHKNVERFSWRRCAEETLVVYSRALSR